MSKRKLEEEPESSGHKRLMLSELPPPPQPMNFPSSSSERHFLYPKLPVSSGIPGIYEFNQGPNSRILSKKSEILQNFLHPYSGTGFQPSSLKEIAQHKVLEGRNTPDFSSVPFETVEGLHSRDLSLIAGRDKRKKQREYWNKPEEVYYKDPWEQQHTAKITKKQMLTKQLEDVASGTQFVSEYYKYKDEKNLLPRERRRNPSFSNIAPYNASRSNLINPQSPAPFYNVVNKGDIYYDEESD